MPVAGMAGAVVDTHTAAVAGHTVELAAAAVCALRILDTQAAAAVDTASGHTQADTGSHSLGSRPAASHLVEQLPRRQLQRDSQL